jgi:hypothetical protein
MKAWIVTFTASVLLCSFAQFTEEEHDLINKVTWITTTSPIPSNPSTELLEKVQESWIARIPALHHCKKIIVFDGVPHPQRYRALAYTGFIFNCEKLIAENPNFANTTLVINQEHKHLANSLREAIKQVDTPYVLIHQHDFVLIRSFDFFNLVRSMDMNSNLKMIRFNKFSNLPNHWDGPIDNFVDGGTLIPLMRTFGWSDNDHFARTDYYTDFVLPKVTWNGAMEWFLHDQEKIKANHKDYGCYLYGSAQEGAYLYHIDGKFYFPNHK